MLNVVTGFLDMQAMYVDEQKFGNCYVLRPDSPTMTREQSRTPLHHTHGDLTSLAPHERLSELPVVPREKTIFCLSLDIWEYYIIRLWYLFKASVSASLLWEHSCWGKGECFLIFQEDWKSRVPYSAFVNTPKNALCYG